MGGWTGAQVGDELPARTIGPVTAMDFARFSVSMEDPNRVHIEAAVAASAGLPSVIGSGGIVQGLMDDLVADWAGKARCRVVRNRILAPLLPDTTITATGSVTERSGRTIVVAVRAVDQDGNALGDATATLEAP
ncbi:MAG TPA: MaoC/PaaZ C-terminal domain-containing protein [Pseudonocardiaceae bacterium]